MHQSGENQTEKKGPETFFLHAYTKYPVDFAQSRLHNVNNFSFISKWYEGYNVQKKTRKKRKDNENLITHIKFTFSLLFERFEEYLLIIIRGRDVISV